jgi:hypothetical protein
MKHRFPREALACVAVAAGGAAADAQTLAERNAQLLQQLQEVHRLRSDQMDRIMAIFAGSRIIGQGNPATFPARIRSCG